MIAKKQERKKAVWGTFLHAGSQAIAFRQFPNAPKIAFLSPSALPMRRFSLPKPQEALEDIYALFQPSPFPRELFPG
jgi:hypothetical protein